MYQNKKNFLFLACPCLLFFNHILFRDKGTEYFLHHQIISDKSRKEDKNCQYCNEDKAEWHKMQTKSDGVNAGRLIQDIDI